MSKKARAEMPSSRVIKRLCLAAAAVLGLSMLMTSPGLSLVSGSADTQLNVRTADGRLQRSFKDGRWVGHVVMSVNREEFAAARERWMAEPAPLGAVEATS